LFQKKGKSTITLGDDFEGDFPRLFLILKEDEITALRAGNI